MMVLIRSDKLCCIYSAKDGTLKQVAGRHNIGATSLGGGGHSSHATRSHPINA